MHSVAIALTDQQMRDVAAYFAALPAAQPGTLIAIEATGPPPDEVFKEGRALAESGAATQGVPACGTCHGPQGGGLPPLYPALAGQYPAYLESQLRAFRDGTRGGDPGGVMHAVARGMTDEQINAAAQFYGASQPVRPVPQRAPSPPAPSTG
jgi:cytochrome c553